MDVNVIYFDPWSGRLMDFYVWMICGEVGVVCHSSIDVCNPCMWSMNIMTYSWVAAIIPMLWPGVASV